MNWKLELIVVPVSDVDRAKAFYAEKAGFKVDVDHRAGEDFRVVQLTPPGSACSIALMKSTTAPGSLNGLQLVVSDLDAACAELVGRGMEVSEPYHFEAGGQVPGPDPQRPITHPSSPSKTPTATAGWSRSSGVNATRASRSA